MAKLTQLQQFLNMPLVKTAPMRRAVRQGDLFGIELECEGKNVNFNGDYDEILTDWAPHEDGSLRNNHGQACEWVFNGPVDYDESVGRVNKLFDYFENRKSKLVTSNRTSTHVHFNMGDKNMYQLVNMYILFTIFEDLLDRYCGDDRNGNLFCLSSRHAHAQVRWAERMFLETFRIDINDNNRYCSFNMAALNKFGTVEFRGMRGLDHREDMLDWLSIINEFARYACYTMNNPVRVIEDISVKTPRGFMQEVFSPANYKKLTFGLEEHLINTSIYEGVRMVQMMCYKIGTEFDQVKIVGPDFWATLGKGKGEPQLDVNPEDIKNGRKPAKARGEPGLLNPFRPGLGGMARQQAARDQARRQAMLEAEMLAGMQAPDPRGPHANPAAEQPVGGFQRVDVWPPLENPWFIRPQAAPPNPRVNDFAQWEQEQLDRMLAEIRVPDPQPVEGNADDNQDIPL